MIGAFVMNIHEMGKGIYLTVNMADALKNILKTVEADQPSETGNLTYAIKGVKDCIDNIDRHKK